MISNPPYGEAQEHTFGQSFNYAAWAPNSSLSFHNVTWDGSYRDIVGYTTQAQLDDFLDHGVININGTASPVKGPEYTTGASYLRANEPVVVGLPFNQCFKYNYLRVTNPTQPITGADEPRTFYYFIVGVEYMAPQATRLTLQLDVWQTFSRFVTFGRCYIERGHIGIANSNQFKDHGREYLTVPEGLDTGSEYVVSDHMEHIIAEGKSTDYTVMVTTTVTWQIDPGTIDAPKLQTAQGTIWERIPNGCEIYLMTPTDFMQFMLYATEVPWVTQGIISITAVPDIYAEVKAGVSSTEMTLAWAGNAKVLSVIGGEAIADVIKIADDWRAKIAVPSRYSNLKKFQTYPYAMLEMTSYTGNPVILKPECLAMDDLYVGMGMHLVPPNSRIAFYPFKYNGKEYASDTEALADKSSDTLPNDYAEYLDVTTGIMNLPQFSLVNDSYLGFMASNQNRIAYGYSSADWSQNRASQSATNAVDVARNSIQNSYMNAMNERNATMGQGANSIVKGIAGGAQAGMEGMGTRATGGSMAAAAAAGIGIGALADVSSLAMQGNVMTTNATNNMLVGVENARMNEKLAISVSKGDHENEIRGINARVQDTKMLQPSTSGQMGGEAFNLVMAKWGVFFRVKTLQAAVRNAIGEYWLRYGYAINRFHVMPSDYKVMTKFTYWKLKETYLTSGACPELYKQAIRGIFEKGVTVWTTPTDIASIDLADNTPLSGVTL